MSSLRYVIGDATRPEGPGPKVICHCCNDEGGWGSGFVVALSNRWSRPEMIYRRWAAVGGWQQFDHLQPVLYMTTVLFELGNTILVQVEEDIWVANIIGQHKTIKTNPKPIRYDALERGLLSAAEACVVLGATVHMPRIGAGLAKGDWNVIEGIIIETLVTKGLDVTVYDLPTS